MTAEERSIFYAAREAYRWKCEDFREDLKRFFETFKPRNNEILLQKHHP